MEDHEVLTTAISCFLGSGNPATRNTMLKVARKLLDRYNVSHVLLPGLIVKAEGEKWVRLEARQEVKGNACPGCGVNYLECRLLMIRQGQGYEVASYGCPACNSVFRKKHVLSPAEGGWGE